MAEHTGQEPRPYAPFCSAYQTTSHNDLDALFKSGGRESSYLPSLGTLLRMRQSRMGTRRDTILAMPDQSRPDYGFGQSLSRLSPHRRTLSFQRV